MSTGCDSPSRTPSGYAGSPRLREGRSPSSSTSTFGLLDLLSCELLSAHIMPHALCISANVMLVNKELAALGGAALADQDVRAQVVVARLRRLSADARAVALYDDTDRARGLRHALLPEQQTPEERADALLVVQALLAGEEDPEEAICGLVEAAGAAGDGVAVRGLLRRRPGCLDERRLGALASKAIGGRPDGLDLVAGLEAVRTHAISAQHEAVAEAALEVWLDAVGPAGGAPEKGSFLHRAAGFGLTAVVRLLLARGGPAANEPDVRRKALGRAMQGGHAAAAHLLLAAGAPLTASMLEMAARGGSAELVGLALAQGGPEANEQGRKDHALLVAAAWQHPGAARVLLAAGASPVRTLATGIAASVGVLVEAGVDVASQLGEEALLGAAEAGRADNVLALLRAGAGERPGVAAAALERALERGNLGAVGALAALAGRPEVAIELLERAVRLGRFKEVGDLAGPMGRPEVAAALLERAVAEGDITGARVLAEAAGLPPVQVRQAEREALAGRRAGRRWGAPQ